MEHWLARMQLTELGTEANMTLAKFNTDLGWHERNTANLTRDFKATFNHLGRGQDADHPPTDFAFYFNRAKQPDTEPVAAEVEYSAAVAQPTLVVRSDLLGGEVVLGQFDTATGWHVPVNANLTKSMVNFLHNTGIGTKEPHSDFELVVEMPLHSDAPLI